MAYEEQVKGNQTDSRFVAPWASGENLRVIERNVLIPRIMKTKAKVLCKDYMDSFERCVNGKTVSMGWTCSKETKAMKNCLKEELAKPELFEECRLEYLKTREEFQNNYVETGATTRTKKKDPGMGM